MTLPAVSKPVNIDAAYCFHPSDTSTFTRLRHSPLSSTWHILHGKAPGEIPQDGELGQRGLQRKQESTEIQIPSQSAEEVGMVYQDMSGGLKGIFTRVAADVHVHVGANVSRVDAGGIEKRSLRG